MASDQVETPTGKGSGDENFPVGSFLIPAPLRAHVAIFYAFARAADDIADNPALSPEDKIARLDKFEAAVTGADTSDAALAKAHRMHRSLEQTGVSAQHCVDLLAAFKQDAVKQRYDDWADLMGYCALSANPVGRYLIDLHGEPLSTYPPSDALCSALQVLNHLQDVKDDYRTMDRVYVPQDWLAREALDVTALDADAASPAMRRVLDQCLDGIAELLAEARLLPGAISSIRFAMETAAIVRLAERLEVLLRAQDPIAGRVEAGKLSFLLSASAGALGAATRHILRGGQ